MTGRSYNKKVVFGAACTGMLLFGMMMISLGSILPELIKKFDLDEVSTGAVLTLLPTGVLLASIVFGPLIDWLAYKKIMISGTIIAILAIYGLVFSESLFLLNLAVFFIGLGGGLLNGLTNALVSEISLDDRSAKLSFLGVFYGVGALGTPVLFGFLQGLYSFEIIFAWVASLMFLPLLFFVIIRFPKSEEKKEGSFNDGLKMIADPLLLLFGFILFFQSGIEGIISNWTTTFLEKSRAINASTALFILSGFVLAFTCARILMIRLLLVYAPIKVMISSFYIAIIGSLMVWAASSAAILGIGIAVIGLGMACGFPVILSYIGQIYTKLSGTAFSIVITIALVGNVFANYLMGLVSEKFGIGMLPLLILIAMLVVLGLLFFTRSRYKHEII